MVLTNYRYTMNAANRVAAQAAQEIEAWLRCRPATLAVHNVEQDPAYRAKDIDILWTYTDTSGHQRTATIEIKGDRWHQTGNYFLETVSNEAKQTPGCFLYSEAEFLFYYFIEKRELHILRMQTARAWFIRNLEQFSEKKTTTPLRNGSHYNTIGRLVPIRELQAAVPVRVFVI